MMSRHMLAEKEVGSRQQQEQEQHEALLNATMNKPDAFQQYQRRADIAQLSPFY
jgi:hypothetical protein